MIYKVSNHNVTNKRMLSVCMALFNTMKTIYHDMPIAVIAYILTRLFNVLHNEEELTWKSSTLLQLPGMLRERPPSLSTARDTSYFTMPFTLGMACKKNIVTVCPVWQDKQRFRLFWRWNECLEIPVRAEYWIPTFVLIQLCYDNIYCVLYNKFQLYI